MRHLQLDVLLATVGCACAATAQVQWSEASPTTVPAARFGHAMAFDSVSQSVLMFAGQTSLGLSGYVNELWSWSGADWTQLAFPGPTPSMRSRSAICADGTGGMLVFGGEFYASPTIWLGDTWRLQSNQWTQVATTGPDPREGHAMVQTPQGVLLFGGDAPGFFTPYDDTWLWNGSVWTELTPPTSPPQRTLHGMVWDSVRNVVVLFGGKRHATRLDDTWEWNGTTWSQRYPLHRPAKRYDHAMMFSPNTDKTIVFGGQILTSSGAALAGDTWLWDGADWQQAAATPAPSPRSAAPMAFSPISQTGVLFGGVTGVGLLGDDTHELRELDPSLTPFGSGCAGPNGLVPSLDGAPGELPRVGTTMHFRIGSLPPSFSIPLFALGLSNTTASGPPPFPLPLDLGPFGWPGCFQLVSTDVTSATAGFGAPVDFPLAIPLNAQLLGFTFYAQAMVFYQPTGVGVSHGLTAVVGS